MALASSDDRDLVLPLYAGIDENPPMATFLRRLLARTGASRACLLTRDGGAAAPIVIAIASAADPDDCDIDALNRGGLVPYASLRPQRVYALEEFIAADSAETASRQREVLNRAGIAHARIVRIEGRGDHGAWLMLLHDRRSFDAADSALLSALAPHVAQALHIAARIGILQLRAAMAEDALAMIGVGQAAFDADARVVAANAVAADALDLQTGGRPQLRARAMQALGNACAMAAAGTLPGPQVIRVDERQPRDLLLRAGPGIMGAVAVGLVRHDRRADHARAAGVVAATLDLSAREAALAEAMARGRSIVDAGAALQLTPETARNYSKRIYAKTGASGQSDLVRRLLTGLAPFA